MKVHFKQEKELSFFLIITGLFLIIISPDFLSEGMFMDGLFYSTIAKNLANGIGSFWNPHFTNTLLSEFHEHPPLAFAFQSVFYKVFGESRYIDKLYSFLVFSLNGYLIIVIWKKFKSRNAWLPLLFWLSMPLVFWSSTNNMLENTMSVFIMLSIIFYLKSEGNKYGYLFIFLSGFILVFGFLTKGFVTFFPLIFPFIFWLVFRKRPFKKILLESIIMGMSFIIPMLILIVFSPAAKVSLQKYIETQVIHSIADVVTVKSRFEIILIFLSEMIPPLLISFLIIFWGWKKKVQLYGLKNNLPLALTFFLFGLTGVLPIMISMKQSGFYILPAFPFFALAFGLFLVPLVEYLLDKADIHSLGFKIFKWASYCIFFIGIISVAYFADSSGRDYKKLKDIHTICSVIPEGTVINILPEMWQDWGLHGYFGRYKNISLDPKMKNERKYLLIDSKYLRDKILPGPNYKKVDIKTNNFILYERNTDFQGSSQ